MSAHTPGPWTAKFRPTEVDGVNVAFYVSSETRFNITSGQSQEHLGEDGIHAAECEANARLIAAAPDLLEALEVAAEALSDLPLMDPRIVAIRAAIAKATGQKGGA